MLLLQIFVAVGGGGAAAASVATITVEAAAAETAAPRAAVDTAKPELASVGTMVAVLREAAAAAPPLLNFATTAFAFASAS